MLAADDGDADPNLVPGADTDDMRGVDETRNEDGRQDGGDEQSAHGVDEDATDAEQREKEDRREGDVNNNEEIDAQLVAAQIYTERSTNVGNKRSALDRAQIKAAYDAGDLRVTLNSIFPRGGPLAGHTKVTVRADGLEDYVEVFPDPKCKFGGNDKIVEANYIKCTKRPLTFYEGEKSAARNYTCVQCEDSPPHGEAEIISLSVSLTGKFDDVYSSRPYRYYEAARVDAIYPRYGPKDGDTVVQVWGANFLDLGDDFRCNFGTKSTKAQFVTDSFIWCRSAQSAVVGKAMPFSVSLNRQ
jgi:hypothetical protein